MNGFIEVKNPEGHRRLLKTDDILRVDEVPGEGVLIHTDSWVGDGLVAQNSYEEVVAAITASQYDA